MHSIWDATLGRLVQTYFHEQQPTDVSFTTQHGASGSVPLIVTASADGVVRAWDTRDRPENSGVYSFNHQHAVRQLVFTGDSTIISFGAQHTRIWDSRMVAERVFDHIGTTYVRELPGSVLADAKLGKIVLMSDAGSLSVYDTRTGNALHDFGAGHVRTARVLRTDGSTVVTGNSSGTVSVWDITSGNYAWKRDIAAHSAAINDLQFDGIKLLTGSTDKSISVSDIRTGNRYVLASLRGSVSVC